MANADTIALVADIVKADKARRFVVVSAPGKREKTDIKVTDLLYSCAESGNFEQAFGKVKKRFEDIVKGFGSKVTLDINAEERKIAKWIQGKKCIKDYLASRGEYLAAKIMADILGYEFIDASEIIKFSFDGQFLADLTHDLTKARLAKVDKGAVIPGFYGSSVDGEQYIKTFSRGGSDVTGAIIARAVDAVVYENWTDVDGFMKCDPRIVQDAKLIDVLTYKELRELSYMGANVLHPDSIFPVRAADIPINIRNTFNRKHYIADERCQDLSKGCSQGNCSELSKACPARLGGTMIVPTKFFSRGDYFRQNAPITGIAGKKDFVAVTVEKSMLNNEIGFVRKMLKVLEDDGISVEHIPTGIDTVCVVIDKAQFDSRQSLKKVVEDIQRECKPDTIAIIDNIALMAVVGHGMIARKGTAADICAALRDADINIRMIDQGSSELNIILAVDNKDFDKALKALYGKLVD